MTLPEACKEKIHFFPQQATGQTRCQCGKKTLWEAKEEFLRMGLSPYPLAATVLYCDGVSDAEGDVFELDGIEIPADPVPVTVGTEIVGTVLLRKDKQSVVGLFMFEDAKLPKGWQALTPSIRGAIKDMVQTEHGRTIQRAAIHSIALSLSPNQDSRIVSFDIAMRQ